MNKAKEDLPAPGNVTTVGSIPNQYTLPYFNMFHGALLISNTTTIVSREFNIALDVDDREREHMMVCMPEADCLPFCLDALPIPFYLCGHG